ncbi:uncharacterized protein EDB93DRAFT_152048 [Suillus bovinus]|uniref:uncharacterized protein n=1 Tax=Suillus bovinus TaxID=48563 RepID=UPI001B880367|nr:uncharacterized protein EDB93DRAFT_152048 [Suillus bovinus]KAG2128644.1 hypothetical protein EDB93DRAFT_152048 [Suillus bovinus]
MARTKQVPPSKFDVGKAQAHVSIIAPGQPKIEIPGGPAQTVPSYVNVSSPLEVKNIFCILCRDLRGNLNMFTCDECPRVICTRCVDVPPNYIGELKETDVKFRCILCHTALMKKLDKPTPYYGFLRGGKPVLPFFLPICTQLETSRRSEISASHILIIHFTLVDHATVWSPADMMYQFLVPYFPHGGLCKLDVVFDLGSPEKIKGYYEQCKLANDILSQDHHKFVCVITTRTDDDGDPFIGHTMQDESGYYSSVSVPEFLDVLFKPWQDVITRAKDTTLIFMGC